MKDKMIFNKTRFCTYLVWIMLITFVGLSTSACSTDTKIVLTTGFKDGEIFRIENISCYETEAYIYLANIHNQYTNVYGNEIWSTSQNGVSLAENVKSTVLARLSRIKMMRLMADTYGISLSDDELQAAEKAAREYFSGLTETEKTAMGDVSQEIIAGMYQDYAIANKVYEHLTSDVNTEVSDDEARTIIIKQVFVSYGNGQDAESYAADALYQLENGMELDDVILKYSDGDSELLYYKKGDMDPQLADVAFALAEGERSQVIAATDGYYILYCVSPNDTSKTEASKAEIVAARKQQAFNAAYEAFRADKACYLNEELWNSIDYVIVPDGGTADFFDIYDKYF